MAHDLTPLESFSLIVNRVAKRYRVPASELLTPSKGRTNPPRDEAIYLSRSLIGLPRSRVCRAFALVDDSSLTYVMKRLQERLERSPDYRRELGTFIAELAGELWGHGADEEKRTG